MLAITKTEYDSVKSNFILHLDNGEQIIMSNIAVEEMLGQMPQESEVVHIRSIIKKIRDMRNKRVKDFEVLDKKAEALDKELEKAQTALGNCSGKLCVDQNKAIIDAIRSRKAVLQERRHLLKLSHIDEGALRLELAKLTKGTPQKKD